MEKRTFIITSLTIAFAILAVIYCAYYVNTIGEERCKESLGSYGLAATPVFPKPASKDVVFQVYVDGELRKEWGTFQEAVNYANTQEKGAVKEKGKSGWLWDNYPPYIVFTSNVDFTEFETFAQAVAYGKEHQRAFIYHRKDNSQIWSNVEPLKEEFQIPNVPVIYQFPELPRGCEVTSLAMLINHRGEKAEKVTLSKEIKKDPTPCTVVDGVIHYGDPNKGFVGSMEDLSQSGYGVYHQPLYELLKQYYPRSAIDISGCAFEDVFPLINKGNPIVVIINSQYQKLPQNAFITWQTPQGPVRVTYEEHAVLVTGYDEDYIYFNDPMGKASYCERASFIQAWEQMGRQGVTLSV